MTQVPLMIKDIEARLLKLNSEPKFQLLLLGMITLVAFALRFYKLGEWSFWGDEMYTIRDSHNVFNLGLTSQKPSRIATHVIITYLGTNEWSTRLFPAVIGAISVTILYFPIKKTFGSGVALLAGLLLAISPWHLYWSQNARFYTPLLLFYTLALLTFYIAIEEDHLEYLFLFMALAGAAVWEHLTALIIGPTILCYLVLVKVLPFEKPAGLRLRNIAILILPGFILGLFFILPKLQNPAKWLEYFGYVNNNPIWILAGVVYYVGLPVICMATLGAIYLLTQKNRAAMLLTLSAILPLLAIMAIALVQFSANRYAFVSLSSWIILAAIAARELFAKTQESVKYLAVGVIAILLLVPLSENALYYRYQNGNRDNWRAAFALIREKREANDLVVVPHTLVADYYLQDESISMDTLDLNLIKASEERVWFVADMTTEEKYPEVYRWIRGNTQLIANLDVHFRARNFKMRVYLYEAAISPKGRVSR